MARLGRGLGWGWLIVGLLWSLARPLHAEEPRPAPDLAPGEEGRAAEVESEAKRLAERWPSTPPFSDWTLVGLAARAGEIRFELRHTVTSERLLLLLHRTDETTPVFARTKVYDILYASPDELHHTTGEAERLLKAVAGWLERVEPDATSLLPHREDEALRREEERAQREARSEAAREAQERKRDLRRYGARLLVGRSGAPDLAPWAVNLTLGLLLLATLLFLHPRIGGVRDYLDLRMTRRFHPLTGLIALLGGGLLLALAQAGGLSEPLLSSLGQGDSLSGGLLRPLDAALTGWIGPAGVYALLVMAGATLAALLVQSWFLSSGGAFAAAGLVFLHAALFVPLNAWDLLLSDLASLAALLAALMALHGDHGRRRTLFFFPTALLAVWLNPARAGLWLGLLYLLLGGAHRAESFRDRVSGWLMLCAGFLFSIPPLFVRWPGLSEATIREAFFRLPDAAGSGPLLFLLPLLAALGAGILRFRSTHPPLLGLLLLAGLTEGILSPCLNPLLLPVGSTGGLLWALLLLCAALGTAKDARFLPAPAPLRTPPPVATDAEPGVKRGLVKR